MLEEMFDTLILRDTSHAIPRKKPPSTIPNRPNLPTTSQSIQLLSEEKKTMTQHLKDILNFSEAQLTCAICSDLMDNPVSIVCGHTFCRSCIQDWFQHKENCPCCREPCTGGETSEPIVPLESMLKVIKPLIIQRDKEIYDNSISQRSLSEVLSKNSVVEEERFDENNNMLKEQRVKEKEERIEAMQNMMRKSILEADTEVEKRSLEIALTLVKCAMAKDNYDPEEFSKDMERFNTHPQEVLDKYMDDPTLNDVEYQYVPKVRKTRITLHWPNRNSLIQMFFALILAVFCYWILKELEDEGFKLLAEPLLRAIGLLNIFLDLFTYFN